MSSGPRVTVTKEIVNMEDFYLLTVKELPELSGFVEMEKNIFRSMVRSGSDGVSFLLRLAIVVLNDLGRIRKLNVSLPDVGNDVWNLDVCEGFLRIVKEWLEENNGRGNLLQITEALRSNGRANIAEILEQLFLRYSLPLAVKDDEGRNNNVYSLSKDILQGWNKKEVSCYKSANDVNSAVERALQNSVILEEVFKKLQPKEQKAFRLVTPVWMEETFSFWRKSAQLRIKVSGGGFNLLIGAKKGIAMSSYMDMVELDRKLQGRKRSPGIGSNYDLVGHPFRRYQLSYKDNRHGPGPHPLTVTSFFYGPVENNFWKLCGPLIEDLQIEDATFDAISEGKNSLYKTCEMLLLDTCPSLKVLKISNSCKTEYSGPRRQTPAIKNGRRKPFVQKKSFAGNLHTLIVGIRTNHLEGILRISPSLKTLVIEIEGDINSLAYPTRNGEYIKLETLKITYPCYYNVNPRKFLSLRKYAELLANKEFNSLNHLSLDGVYLSDARTPPFDLYAAIAHCSSTLKSLNLTVLVTERDCLHEGRKWFTDLSSFSFPNLTALKLCFDFSRRQCGSTQHIKFDFRTLEGMRMLEQLEIKVGKNEVRNPGTQDWICDGDRTSYLPSGVDFALNSDADPILCTNLKEFTFIGWGLNEEDITILSSWFPNLTHLDAGVKPEAVTYLLDNWTKLEKIDIKTDRLISLLKFRPLKEKSKHLRVIQTISWSNGRNKCVELKEGNGILYFLEVKGANE